MSAHAHTLAVPARARALRAWLRRARGRHHTRPLGELLTDLYMVAWVAVVYGAAAAVEVRRFLKGSVGFTGLSPAQNGLTVGVFLVVAALVWRGLRALGPLVVGPAEQAWCLATPLDRRGWLMPRLGTLLVIGAGVGAALAAVVALFAVRDTLAAWAALGAVVGVLGLALSVVAQAAPSQVRWPGVVGLALGGAGLVALAGVSLSPTVGVALPSVEWGAPGLWALVGSFVALAAAARALGALGRLDRHALARGAPLVGAATTATTALDPSHFTSVVAARRWRAVGRLKSRPFRPWRLSGAGHLARPWVLVQAELRRQLRRPGLVGVFVVLTVAQYAVAAAMPGLATSTRLIGAYLAGMGLSSGLRVIHRSRGLCRALGGRDLVLRASHLVAPAVGVALWWAVTRGAEGIQADLSTLVVLPGILGAVYRTATRPPMKYDSVPLDTPFGTIPWSLIGQLVRGPDLLAILIVVRVLWAR